jgi:hypothetical protein
MEWENRCSYYNNKIERCSYNRIEIKVEFNKKLEWIGIIGVKVDADIVIGIGKIIALIR